MDVGGLDDSTVGSTLARGKPTLVQVARWSWVMSVCVGFFLGFGYWELARVGGEKTRGKLEHFLLWLGVILVLIWVMMSVLNC